MTRYGHFGLASVRLAIGSVVALLLHLLLPYGVVQYRGPAAPDSNILTRGEWMELRGLAPSEMLATNASPDVALAGLVIAAVAGGLLVFLGFQPLQVAAARWIGAGLSALASLGLGLAWMQSFYSIGTGFSAFLDTVFGSEFRTAFWAISPLFTAAIAGWLMWEAGRITKQVVSTRDGLREHAQTGLRLGMVGMILMASVLLVPWSIGLFPDGVSDSLGAHLPEDDEAPFWFSSEDIQSVTPAEASGRIRNSEPFDVLSSSIHIFLALAWSLHVHAALQALGATAVSAGASPGIIKGTRYTILGAAVLLLLSFVMYVLAWIFVQPGSEAGDTYLPGFWPLIVLAPLLWLARAMLPGIPELFRPSSFVDAPPEATSDA